MSSEHKRPLYAFAAVAVLCACLVASGLRSEALVGFLDQVPAADRIAAVVAPETSDRNGDDASGEDADRAPTRASDVASGAPQPAAAAPGTAADVVARGSAQPPRAPVTPSSERSKSSREGIGHAGHAGHTRLAEHVRKTHALRTPVPSTVRRPPARDHGARSKRHGSGPKAHATKPKARATKPKARATKPKARASKPKAYGARKAGKGRESIRPASVRLVRTADHKRSREAGPARHRSGTSAAVRARPGTSPARSAKPGKY